MMNQIISRLGLDASQFQKGLSKADKSVRAFQSAVGQIGLGAFGITAIARTFSAVIQRAREAEGELDKNTAAVKRFAEGIDGLKEASMKAFTAIVGGLNRAGESMGGFINRIRHGSEESERLEKINRDAAEAITAIDARAEAHAKARESAQKAYEASMERLLKHQRDQLSLDEQITNARFQVANAERIIADTNEGSLDNLRARTTLAEQMVTLAELEKKQSEERAREEERAAAAREKQTEKEQREARELATLRATAQEEYQQLLFSQLTVTGQIQDVEDRMAQLRAASYETETDRLEAARELIRLQSTLNSLRENEQRTQERIAAQQEKVIGAQRNFAEAMSRAANPLQQEQQGMSLEALASGGGDRRQQRLAETVQRAARQEQRLRERLSRATTNDERRRIIDEGRQVRARGMSARARLGDALQSSDRDPVGIARDQLEAARESLRIEQEQLDALRKLVED